MKLRLISALVLTALLASTPMVQAVDSGGSSTSVSVSDQLSAARAQIKSQKWAAAIDTLKLAREFEQHSPGCRLSMIRMLDREIRRQEKAQAQAA